MSRYAIGRVVRRPRAHWLDDENPMLPSLTVDDHEAADTGLITTAGEPIMRLPEEMGFHNPRPR
jgi:hypothetical protein